ncbi:Glucuronoyl esterase catalytic domain from Hypocrea Jecorina [Pholiota conissans]|uniref:(4-O-methyl)-D-glucuronate--lignin esterase n=1 Tax=Pholiota conissans TaxID=109636 RepID=A0A9P6CXZ3_9AGAR|nr:Glucuronoyl esterase catalytic domain from Hypocrea Jecorina [Pholiota conissans]
MNFGIMTFKSYFVGLALALPLFAASAPNPDFSLPAPRFCPELPQNLTLTSDAKLPNPFKFAASSAPIHTKADWSCRREEINELFQRYELGTLPPKPEAATGTINGNTLTVDIIHANKSISFNVTMTLPKNGTAPFPAVIGVGGISIPIPPGVATLVFNNNQIALQNDATSRGIGDFYTLFGANATASSMTAWAWAIGRIIDVLENMPEETTKIDLSRLGVTGCSRNGKGALVAGAFESRIALTIPQESGSGGEGCWRISDWMLANGTVTQTASEIVQENVWFSETFALYANDVDVLPFDHHMLAGLVAPRALFVIDNTGIDWLGPESNFGCMKTANKIFQALGVPDHMGFSGVGNLDHCAFPASQQPDLDAFFNKFFFGQKTNTSIIETDGPNDLGFVDSDWIDWEVPQLA